MLGLGLLWRAIMSGLGGTGGGVYAPSLDFSDARNSQYIGVI